MQLLSSAERREAQPNRLGQRPLASLGPSCQMPQASPDGDSGVKRAFCTLCAAWLCHGARDTLLRPHPRWLHGHGDASKIVGINELILTH